MSYYFTNDPNIKSNRRMIDFRFLTALERFASDNGVFSKETLDFGSRVMLETLVGLDLKGSLLDLGCGIGVIGILLKKYKPELKVTMVDVNETAVSLATENSKLYQQDNTVLVSDGFANINTTFDTIVSNPPIRTGKKVIYELFRQSFDYLNEDGKLYLVIRDKQGAASAVKYLSTLCQRVEVVKKEKGYWIILACKDLTK